MKRIILVLLLFLPISLWADQWIDSNTHLKYEYDPNGSTAVCTGGTSKSKVGTAITIPEKITIELDGKTKSFDVTAIGESAFITYSNLISVNIPNTVTTIGEKAFYRCTKLTNVNINNNITTIGKQAFYNCQALSAIHIPNGIETIEENVFYGCQALESISIPSSVHIIGNSAFQGCKGLKELFIPANVKSIGASAFSGCSDIEKLTINNKEVDVASNSFSGLSRLKEITLNCAVIGNWFTQKDSISVLNIEEGTIIISDRAFANCSNLIELNLPNTLTTIGSYSFDKCIKLPSLAIPSSVTTMGKNAFDGCNGLESISLGTGLSIIEDYTFHNCSNLKSITIPSNITSIGSYSFGNCDGLISLDLPQSVVNVAGRAFSSCDNLESVTIRSDWLSSDQSIFNGCNQLKTVTFHSTNVSAIFSGNKIIEKVSMGDEVTAINDKAFMGCLSLSSLQLSENLISIGNSSFRNCSSLKNVILPDKIKTIGKYAFSSCAFSSIIIPDNGVAIGDFAFQNCINLTSFTVPKTILSIGNKAFSGCKNLAKVTFHCPEVKDWFSGNNCDANALKEVILGSEVKSIGDYAFYGCCYLTNFTVPYGVNIGKTVFEGCSGLTSVTLHCSEVGDWFSFRPLNEIVWGEEVTSIGDKAFSGCTNLTSITIPNSVTSIGSKAFSGCTGLTSISLPNSVTSIGKMAFEGCTGLTTLVIPDNIKSIESDTFKDCTGLISISIPNSVTSIEYRAFGNCTSLASITIPDSVTSIGNMAFEGCSGLVSLTIPSHVTSIGTEAFKDCTGLTSIAIYNSTTNLGKNIFAGCPRLFFASFHCKEIGSWLKNISSIKDVTIGEEVSSIGPYAFGGCNSLRSITIPNSVTTIGDGAFRSCTGLLSVTSYISAPFVIKNVFDEETYNNAVLYVPKSALNEYRITEGWQSFKAICAISDNVFVDDNVIAYECFDSSMTAYVSVNQSKDLSGNVKIEKQISHDGKTYTVVGLFDCAFTDCKRITSVELPDGIESLGAYSFAGCSGLTTIAIPNDVTKIQEGLFEGCSGLISINIPEGVTHIGNSAFKNCSSLAEISIPESVTDIGSSAFNGCSGLTKIIIPNNVAHIGEHVLDDCNGLSVIINCNWIGNWLQGNTSIKEIVLSGNITSIIDNAFSGCSGLTNITIPDGVTSIGYYAFRGCYSLKSVIIPSSVIGIGMQAFSGCSNLTNVTFKEGVEGIYTSAFSGCSKLTSITLPSSMTHIDMSAFSGCELTNITSLIMDPFVINNNVFSSSTYNTATLNVPFGTKDIYKATNGWKNFKNIQEEKIDAGSSLILAVTDENGIDVTDNAFITWYNTDGTEIGTGKSLNGIEDGTELYYSIELNEYLGRIYREVKMQKVVADDGELSCQLEKIGRVTLEGRVSATDIDEKTATISVRQMLNGKWEQTYTAQANEQGVFKVEVYDDETDIIISGDGYLNTMLHRDNFNGNGNVGTIPMSLISGFAIAANITIENAVADGETENMTEWTDDLNNIEFTLTNSTKGQSITDFTVQNGNVILKSGVSVGDEIILTAMSKKGVFSNTTTSFTIEEGVNNFNLQLTELGGVDAIYANSNNGSTIGYLYDSNGALAAKGSYVGETLSLRHLPSGTYVLISMGNSMLLGSVAHISDLTAIGLVEGTDYVKADIVVSDGVLTALSIGDVPKMDDTRFYYTSSNTYFNVNKASVTAGNYLTLQTHMEFKPEYADKVNDVVLIIDLPEGCELVENSVIANRQAVTHNVNGNQLTIPLNKEQYSSQVRFCIIPVVNQDYTVTAMASFNIDGQVQQPIGTVQFGAKGLSLDVRTKTDQAIITVHGTTKGNSEVSIYDNDVLIGKTISLADGSWLVDCELYKPYSHSFHDIYAKIRTENGMELTSIARQVEYNKNVPVPDKVTMLNAGSITVFDLKGKSSPFYTYTASSSRTHNFTFLAEFTRNDTAVIKNVNIKVLNSDGTIRTLPAIFDGKQNCWVASTNYSSPFKLPMNVTVEYDLIPIEEYIIDEERITEGKINIHNIIDDCVEAIKKVSYKIEEETDNSLVVRLDLESNNSYYLSLAKIELKSITNYIDRAIRIDTGNNTYNIADTLIGSQDILFLWDDKNAYRIAFSEAKSNVKTSIQRAPWDPWFDENDHPIMNRLLRGLNRLPMYGNSDWVDRCDEINDWWRRLFRYKETHIGYRKNTQKLLLATCPDGSYRLSRSQLDWFNMYKGFYDSDADRFEQFLEDRIERYAKSIRRRCYVSAGIQGAAVAASWAFRQFTVVGQEFNTWLSRDPNLYLIEDRFEGEVIKKIADDIGGVSAGNTPNSISAVLGPWCKSEEIKIVQYYNSLNESIKNAYKKCEEDDEEEDYDEPYDDPDNPYFPGKNSQRHVDPSGFVYEAVLSNRLEGVKATCYQKVTGEDMYGDPTEEAVKWNAADYSQVNPQLTDETGFYRWDVPQGWWQVKYEKEGYETAYSDWLPVPPPQLDVNIGMKQSTPPIVKQMRGYERGITIDMSKYMLPSKMTENNITITHKGSAVKGTVEMMNAEQAPLSGETYVQKVKFMPLSRFHVGDEVVVTVHKEVESYCGVKMTADHIEKVKIESEIESIVADSVVTVPYQDEKELRVLVLPKSASAGKTLHINTSSSMIASVNATDIEVDKDGAATLTLSGELPGGAVLSFSIDGSDISATSIVKVVIGRDIVAAPKASILSGENLERGTQIELTCETEGATIYYTLDGSCPCDERSRYEYTGPIVIKQNVTIKAIALSDDMDDSDVATFVYVVNKRPVGDVDDNNVVDVADIVLTINHILGEKVQDTDALELMDMNGDGLINVGDVILLVKTILEHGNAVTVPVMARGDAETIDLTKYTAMQLNVITPLSCRIKDIKLVGDNSGSHILTYQQTGDGSYTVVVYSLGNETFKPVNGCLLEVTTVGDGEASTANVLLATPAGERKCISSLPVGTVTGIGSVNTDQVATAIVYDLRGNKALDKGMPLLQLPNGVYIMNGKKIIR